jgi:hypothetical protein
MEDADLLGHDAALHEWFMAFQRNVFLLGLEVKVAKKNAKTGDNGST